MIIRFKNEFALPVAEVYSYFRTPADWTRLYGLAGVVEDRGDGWFAVPLKRFPFPLVARNTEQEENKHVRWVFRGFWRGEGEVHLAESSQGVVVEGFEEISIRWLFFLSTIVERLFLERRFRTIWEIGWHRLRKREAGGRSARESQAGQRKGD
jgi:hypothetical protein